ncbi:MAG: hypothetical protein M3Q61_04605, partial [Chloroflexota bacterium]|nr:hypothetical protein [Chloroflexota bacterium]
MSAANTSNLSALYKKRWKQLSDEMLFEGSPGYAMVEKKTDWAGTQLDVAIVYGAGGGASADYGKSRARKSPSKAAKMTIETCDEFVSWSVDNKSIRLSRNDTGALRKLLDHEFKMK